MKVYILTPLDSIYSRSPIELLSERHLMFGSTIFSSSAWPFVLAAGGVCYFILSTIRRRLSTPRGSLSDISGPPRDSLFQGMTRNVAPRHSNEYTDFSRPQCSV